MKQLNGTFALLDVADLEATCRSVLDGAIRGAGGWGLPPSLYDSALGYLFGESFKIALSYVDWCENRLAEAGLDDGPQRLIDPDMNRAQAIVARARAAGLVVQSFNTYLHSWLPRRYADWWRKEGGDNRYGDQPTFVGEEHADDELLPYSGGQTWTAEATSISEVDERGLVGVAIATQSVESTTVELVFG